MHDERLERRRRTRRRAHARRARSTRARHELVQRGRPRRPRPPRPRARARRCRRPGGSARPALLDQVSAQRARAPRRASVASASSTSTFVRRLASGVRSSCDASATSWRCASTRPLERLEHRVERVREPAELVVGRRPSMRSSRIRRRGDRLGRLREPPHGPQRRARDHAAQHRREHDAADATIASRIEQPAQHVVDLVQRPGDLIAPPAPGRRREHAQVRARRPARPRAHLRRRRPRDAGRGRTPGIVALGRPGRSRPVGGDELHVALGAAEARLPTARGRDRAARPRTAAALGEVAPRARARSRSESSTSPRSFARTAT